MAARTIGGGGGECTSPTVDAEESERDSGVEHEGQQQALNQALPVVHVSANSVIVAAGGGMRAASPNEAHVRQLDGQLVVVEELSDLVVVEYGEGAADAGGVDVQGLVPLVAEVKAVGDGGGEGQRGRTL